MKTKEKNKLKQNKNRVEKQLLDRDQKSVASFFSKDLLTEEAIYELNKIIEIEQKINSDHLIYETDDKKKDNKTYDFQKFKAIIFSEREIYHDELTLEDALEKQIKFKNDIDKFKEFMKPKNLDKKELLIFENALRLPRG